MIIGFLSSEYPPETHVGGIGTYTYSMAHELAKLGHEIHVVTSTRHHEHSYQDGGVWVHRIPQPRMKPTELRLLKYSLRVFQKLSQIGRPFDLVQTSEFGSEAFWLAIRNKLPLVTRLATPRFFIEQLSGTGFLRRRPLLNWMEKTQTLRSAGIFTSTRALSNKVTSAWDLNPARVEVIPNSIDIRRIREMGEVSPGPDILANGDFILYFGRLEERKGVRVLAQALPAVFEGIPDLRAVFVGSDLGHPRCPMREYIMRSAGKHQKKVRFIDNLPHQKLFPIVNSAKVVVLPSLWEAFGFVCIEAMSLGRPVIATSGSGFAEIIEDDVSGFLVKPGNSQALGEKIIEVLEDESRLQRVSDIARIRAQDFDVTKVSLRLVAYYEKIRDEWAQGRRSN